MDIQDKLVKILTILKEMEEPISRQLLTDIFMGRETKEIQELEMDQIESFGIGEDSDDEDALPQFIDKAIEEGFIKYKPAKSRTIIITPAGKKFRKHPHEVEMSEEEEFNGGSGDVELDDEMLRLMRENAAAQKVAVKSEHTRLQIALIQAIDRKIALDDFAESHNVDLDTVLDEIFNLRKMGKQPNISYFTDEVIGADEVDEVRNSLPDGKFDTAFVNAEWGDVYNVQELRLLELVLS